MIELYGGMQLYPVVWEILDSKNIPRLGTNLVVVLVN